MAEDFDFSSLSEFFDSDDQSDEQGGSTRSVHSGSKRTKGYNSLTTPVVQTATYTFRDTAELIEYMERKTWGEGEDREEYGRYGNPTVNAVERKL
ncbi:MAG TPA: PLP-dependent transferase, partial [Phototrophicaceae bacterium]|nr:PLP-dependent transferase [Phototrophicaceae bacterium]